MVSIYILMDPAGQIRYVGKAKDPEQRLKVHLKTRGVVRWWAEQLSGPPTLRVVDEVGDHLWQHAERFWIKKLRDAGCDLLNRAEGGQGGAYPKGEAQRRAIGEASRKNWTDPAFREKVISGRVGYRHSEETKQKISAAMQGKTHRGVPHTEATKQRLRELHLGVRRGSQSVEARQKMSEAKRRYWHEWRERRAVEAGSVETGATGGSRETDPKGSSQAGS